MRKLFLGVVIAAAAAAAQAGVSAQASITCGAKPSGLGGRWSSSGVMFGGAPTLNVTYSPAADAGRPGLFWLGILTADRQYAFAADLNGAWMQYQGGLYPPHQRYDSGFPSSITVSLPFPTNSMTTSEFVGQTVYVGHGVYTADGQKMVASRRTYLNSIKAERQAQGKWQSAYDDDTQFMWSLVQRDMVDNNKWGSVLTIPFIDCKPQDGG